MDNKQAQVDGPDRKVILSKLGKSMLKDEEIDLLLNIHSQPNKAVEYKCYSCEGKCKVTTEQTRSRDEGMTYFAVCTKCRTKRIIA
jgi:DNA-directed RNA polymerase subunit M/transcription elongation factor TFIIS